MGKKETKALELKINRAAIDGLMDLLERVHIKVVDPDADLDYKRYAEARNFIQKLQGEFDEKKKQTITLEVK